MAIGERSLPVTTLCKLFFASGIAVFADDIMQHHQYPPAEGNKDTFGERVRVTLGNAPRSHGSVTVKLARNLEVSVRTKAEVPHAELPSGAARQDEWRQVVQRQLQEVCANDTEVFISSTTFTDAEGCYLPTDDNIYTSATLDRVVAVVPVSDVEDVESRWVSGTVESTSSVTESLSTYNILVDQECFSDSFNSSVHPSDVETWYCYLDDAANPVEVNETVFDAACGCPSLAPTAVPTPSPVALDDGSVVGESSCDDTESFEITSASAPDVEGCYEFTGVGYLSGGNYFNRTGSDSEIDLALFPLVYENETDARWTLAVDAQDTDDIRIFCCSEEVVDEAHPADASWFCNLNGTSESFSVMTDNVFAVDCGCSSGTDALDADEAVRSSPEISLYGTAATSLVLGLAGVLLGAI